MTAEAEAPPKWWSCDQVQCDRCGHEWVSVYPSGTESVDCSKCGHDQPVDCVHEMRRLESGARVCSKCGAVISQSDPDHLLRDLESMMGLVEKGPTE